MEQQGQDAVDHRLVHQVDDEGVAPQAGEPGEMALVAEFRQLPGPDIPPEKAPGEKEEAPGQEGIIIRRGEPRQAKPTGKSRGLL